MVDCRPLSEGFGSVGSLRPYILEEDLSEYSARAGDNGIVLSIDGEACALLMIDGELSLLNGYNLSEVALVCVALAQVDGFTIAYKGRLLVNVSREGQVSFGLGYRPSVLHQALWFQVSNSLLLSRIHEHESRIKALEDKVEAEEEVVSENLC